MRLRSQRRGLHQTLAPYSDTAASKLSSSNGTSSTLAEIDGERDVRLGLESLRCPDLRRAEVDSHRMHAGALEPCADSARAASELETSAPGSRSLRRPR